MREMILPLSRPTLLALAGAALLAGCGDKDGGDTSGAAVSDDTSAATDDTGPAPDDTGAASDDTGATSDDTGGGGETGETGETGDSGETGDTGEPATECADGAPFLSFDPSASGGDYGERVGDFTVGTLDGDWSLSDNWTGCDSYVFLHFHRDYSYPQGWANSNFEDWLAASPENVHWFFVSYESSAARILEDVEGIQEKVETALSTLPIDEAAAWRERIHFVTDSAWYVDGGLGTTNQSYGLWHTAVDRFQTIRELGYLADPATGWSTVPLEFAAYEPELFNFEAAREVELDAQGATVVRIFDAEYISDSGWAGVRGSADVVFPDAKTMATFDTLELDLTMDCGHPEYDACPEWDYLVYAYLCDSVDESSCGTEFGRWITTYARAGRWVVDASHLLPELADGGEHRIQFYTTQGYTITLDARLYNAGKSATPAEVEPLWNGSRTFNTSYNDGFDAITFTPPVGTSKVELVTIVSGHGYSSDDNYCGEFCNHEHEYTINEAAVYVDDHPEASTTYGCTDEVSAGVTPNQWGTWVYGRGGWCPGWQVDPWTVDITGDVTVGAENTIAYRGLFNGSDPPDESTDGYMILHSYLVYSQ